MMLFSIVSAVNVTNKAAPWAIPKAVYNIQHTAGED
jgi:hypothetical protein